MHEFFRRHGLNLLGSSGQLMTADLVSEPARRWGRSSVGHAERAPLLSTAAARRCERQSLALWRRSAEHLRVLRTGRECRGKGLCHLAPTTGWLKPSPPSP